MGNFDFNFLKKLRFNSIFKYEKSQITTQNNLFLLNNSNEAKDIIKKLSQARKNNLINIFSGAEKNIEDEYKSKNIKPPKSDWLGQFIDHSKDISNNKLQTIWSEILEGQMSNKNTSVRTLSVLRNISSSEANLFNRFLNYKIERFVYYEENKMPSGFLSFDEISLLLEIGLVRQMNVSRIIRPSFKNIGVLGIYYDYFLYIPFKSKKTEIRIPCVWLSSAGIELSEFVKPERDHEYLSCLSQCLKANNLQLKAIILPENGKSHNINFNEGQNIDYY